MTPCPRSSNTRLRSKGSASGSPWRSRFLHSTAGFQVHRADKFIAAPHHARHGLIALAFPGLYRVGLVPGFVELAVLLRQAQAILLAHIEVRTGDHPANGRAGHNLLGLEIHLGQARSILPALYRQPAKTEIVPVAIDVVICSDQTLTKGSIFPERPLKWGVELSHRGPHALSTLTDNSHPVVLK